MQISKTKKVEMSFKKAIGVILSKFNGHHHKLHKSSSRKYIGV
jgi:hypothetical protein